MNATGDPLIHALEEAANSAAVSSYVTQVLERVTRELAAVPGPMAWESIPLDGAERRRYQAEG